MFDHLYSLHVLSETPKVHILYTHLSQVNMRNKTELPLPVFDRSCCNISLIFQSFLGHNDCHLFQYLEIQEKTDRKSLALADCQGLEACHSGLRKSDRRHGCDIRHHQVLLNKIIVILEFCSFDLCS